MAIRFASSGRKRMSLSPRAMQMRPSASVRTVGPSLNMEETSVPA